MKIKRFTKMVLILMPIILLTGCGGNAVDKAINKTLKANYYKGIIDLNIAIGTDDTKNYNVNINGDNKNKLSKTTVEYTNQTTRSRFELYYNSKDKQSYYYTTVLEQLMPEDEIGMGSKEEEDTNKYNKQTMTYMFDLTTLKNILNKPKSIKKENGYYSVKVDSNKVLDVLNNKILISYISLNLHLENKKTSEAEFKVYVHNGYISKIQADLTNLFKEATKVNDEFSEVSLFNFIMDVSTQKKAEELKLTNDIINNAMDNDEAEAITDAYVYISFINTLELEDKEYTKGDEYGQIKPDQVKLKLKDKRVVSGTITINGYKLMYEDNQIRTTK